MKEQKKKTIIITGILLLLLLVIGSTYAYFSIQASSNQTGANIKGSAAKLGNPTLRTEVANLYLNLDANLMSQANAGKTYYANKDASGLALTTNPNYTLATASVPDADAPLYCTYNYKVTASVTKAITDGSDSNVIVTVGNKTMTLKELTTAGTDGIIVSGEFKNLTTGTSQTISLSSSVENTANTQDSLVGNSYTINIAPYNSGDTKAFSCKLAFQFDSNKSLAQNLIDSEWLWQSGLEGDGYRYAGTGIACSYDNGNYVIAADNQFTSPSCPIKYYLTADNFTSGQTFTGYYDSCPDFGEGIKVSCIQLDGNIDMTNIPKNFICFGTTDVSECISNQDKYMYRVIGVFPDESGNQHAKLIKYKQSGSYKWNDINADVNWEASTLYNGLNGEFFLTNTTYDYLQNNTWLNKIEDWTWTAVNTKTVSNNGPYYNNLSPKEIYLHEMNRSIKTNTVGNWTTPSAKIGLMYSSDYILSLGNFALKQTDGTTINSLLMNVGWINPGNNDTTMDTTEWTLSRFGDSYDYFFVWSVIAGGLISDMPIDNLGAVRPVFYLNSSEKLNSGTGTLEDPYILEQ